MTNYYGFFATEMRQRHYVPWPEAGADPDLNAQPALFVCELKGVQSHTSVCVSAHF